MKRVEVIMLPARLDEVADALAEAGIEGMSVYEARVFGGERGRRVVYRGSSHVVDCTPRIKIELIVPDDVVPRVLDALEQSPQTGQADDRRVLISEVADAMRVRTGDRGDGAIDQGACSLRRQSVFPSDGHRRSSD
jgi:nitrogen regulatory protein P-II 1